MSVILDFITSGINKITILFSPPHSISPSHTKGLPHWDYLVICSPNFYEVAFPCVFLLSFCYIFSCFALFMILVGEALTSGRHQ